MYMNHLYLMDWMLITNNINSKKNNTSKNKKKINYLRKNELIGL